MRLHTVLISYNRRELTEIAIDSYLATVTVPHTLLVVDNASDEETTRWLKHAVLAEPFHTMFLTENRYPGFACNRGFDMAPRDATHFHRADNDFRFLPGWCEEVARRFRNLNLGQLGLRTDEEELYAPHNVGGNCVIARELWDMGLRYDERPWPEFPPGITEDSFLSPAVREMGFRWGRVKQPCIEPSSIEDPNDPYYQQSWRDRRIHDHLLKDVDA